MSKKKEWKFFSTPYHEAWIAFRKSDEYKHLSDALQKQGVKMPYRNNIINRAFSAGWRAVNESHDK